jgi:cell division FtsZ-interacting protein ZapD
MHELCKELESARATCSKLHDLNHMQAQRIEALESRLKSAGTSLHDTRNFDAMSEALNTALMQAETMAKRIYELEQQLIDAVRAP